MKAMRAYWQRINLFSEANIMIIKFYFQTNIMRNLKNVEIATHNFTIAGNKKLFKSKVFFVSFNLEKYAISKLTVVVACR